MTEPVSRPAERKRATVLFADIIGFTALSERLGPERAYLIVTECLKRLDAVARKHGGAVDRYLGDCLMAVFGHPVPLTDDAAAGVEAALEMRELVDTYVRELRLEVPLKIQVGVNSGPLVAGDLRGSAIREFHVLGDTVNVSARLKARAPSNGVYVGEQTEAETRERFAYTALDSMQLKGKKKRVAVFECHARRGGSEDGADPGAVTAELVGRESELEVLRAALDRVRAGTGGVVSLVAEDGLGKSRLAAELRSDAADLRWIGARPREPGGAGVGDLELIADLVRSWAGIPAEADPEETASRLTAAARDAFGEATSDILPPLADLLSGRGEPGALTASLLEWVRHLAQAQPLVLVLDDLQGADAASLALLETVIARTADAPVLFLLLARPGGAASDALLERLGERAQALSLAPLPAESARKLLEQLVEGQDLPSDTLARVEARAQGNPLRLILGAFLAPAMQQEIERERAGGERSGETERRRATVLFGDITGFTSLTESLGDAEAYAIVADSLELLDRVARRHGGHVDKYLGDCVMALFGVPVAIEDAPRAAINAAIEMRQVIRELNEERKLEQPLDVHSGINTGLAIAGDVSGPLLREFALMGEPVEVADLLTHQAEAGHIQVGEETWRLARGAFEFEPAAPVELPGRDASVGAYEVLSERVQLHRARPHEDGELFARFVGREGELTALRACLARLAEGRGGVVSVVGEAGMGKSRLLDELRSSDEAQSVAWLVGRSIPAGGQLSFHPFGDLLRSWAGITDDDPDAAVPEKLRTAAEHLFGAEIDAAYPFLASLMGLQLDAADRERLDAVPGESREAVMQANVTELLRRLAKSQPLVLVFDDLQWADLSSIELLESVLRVGADSPILVLNVFRPGHAETSDRVDTFSREQHADRHDRIELGPLDPDTARAMTEPFDIPIEVRLAIVERSAGNPLYVEEVVRSLIEEGAVEFQGGSFRATREIHEAAIPATVDEVVMTRFDRLEPDARQALRTASVIGRTFHAELLEEVFGDAAALERALEAAQAGEFIAPWDSRQDRQFAFKHPMMQEVIYDGMLEATRREHHLGVAEALERAFASRLPGFHAMLAYHYGRAGDSERAEEALFRAGDEAARAAASNEALHFFRESSRLYVERHGEGGDPLKRAVIEKHIAFALANRGQEEEAWEHFDRALELFGERLPSNTLALQARLVLDALRVLARLYVPGASRLRHVASPQEREIVEVMFRRGISQATGQPERFLYDATNTLERVSRLDPGSIPNGAAVYSGAVGVFSLGGISFAVGQRFLDLAREVIDRQDAPPDPFYLLMNFIHHLFAGDWSEQHEIEDAGVWDALRGGRLFEVLQYDLFLIEKRAREGRFESVASCVERIEALWDTYQYAPARFSPGIADMVVAHERREAGGIEAANTYFRNTDQDAMHLHSLGCKTHVQLAWDDLEGAAETIATGEQILSRPGRPGNYHLSAFTTARFALDATLLEREGADSKTRAEAAKRSGRAALRIAAQVAFHQPEVLRLEGRRLWLLGRRKQALASWQRSLATADRLGMSPERARTYAELALRLADTGQYLEGLSAAEYLELASDLMKRFGLATDLSRLERGSAP